MRSERFLYLLLFQASTGDHSHIASTDGIKCSPSSSYQAYWRSNAWTRGSCWSRSTSKKSEGLELGLISLVMFTMYSYSWLLFNIVDCSFGIVPSRFLSWNWIVLLVFLGHHILYYLYFPLHNMCDESLT